VVTRQLGEDDFYAELGSVTRSALRREVQPFYLEPAEQPTVDRFLAGDPQDPTEVAGLHAWYALVSRLTARAVTVARVRVQQDPPNPYQQWERFITPWNVAAGEDLRYLTDTDAQEIGLPPAEADHDWWLLDDARLIVMQFAPDGRRVRTDLVTDPARINAAKIWWRLAHARSTPIRAGQTP
jgi:hypothetical protein